MSSDERDAPPADGEPAGPPADDAAGAEPAGPVEPAGTGPAGAPEAPPSPQVEVTRRRAPRYSRFALVGAVLGLLAAAALALLSPPSEVTRAGLFWLLVLWVVPPAVLGALTVALVVDRRSAARTDAARPDAAGTVRRRRSARRARRTPRP